MLSLDPAGGAPYHQQSEGLLLDPTGAEEEEKPKMGDVCGEA